MKPKGLTPITLLAALALAPAPFHAYAVDTPKVLTLQPPVERPKLGNFVGEPGIDPKLMTEGFLAAHPDLRWRREGLHAFSQKQYATALEQFQRAARYGDKPAQAMLAEMYWKGLGVAQDRAIAYAWMDLAAERMYPNFVILRERYWRELDAQDQQAAIERGQALLSEYGDDVAKPRMAKLLRREARAITGSRTGFVGNVEIIPNTGPLAGTGMRIRGDELFADKYWKPEQYFRMQDEVWQAPQREGKVQVGELQSAESVPAPDSDSDSDE